MDESMHPQTSTNLSQHSQVHNSFWVEVINEVYSSQDDFKTYQLPLARIKKIMKTDEEVKMISQEAPVVFAKACEIFIKELTVRSWLHTEENKRKTLQRNDIISAISESDIYDFLIDIVPREEMKSNKSIDNAQRHAITPELQQYYYQMAQNIQSNVEPPQGMIQNTRTNPHNNNPNVPMDYLLYQQLRYMNQLSMQGGDQEEQNNNNQHHHQHHHDDNNF